MASRKGATPKQATAPRGSSAAPDQPAVKPKKKNGPAKGAKYKTPTKAKIVLPAAEVIPIGRRIYELSAVGATLEQIASVLRIEERTFIRRLNENPDLLSSYKQGKDDTACYVMGKLMELIRKGVPSSIYFFLKTQVGWRETNNLNVVGMDHIRGYLEQAAKNEDAENPIPLLTDEELETMQRLLENAEKRNAELKSSPQGKPN